MWYITICMKAKLLAIIQKIKSIKITKPDLAKFKQLGEWLSNLKFKKKSLITIGVIAIVLLVSVAGRKSPFGKDWQQVLPDSGFFDEQKAEQQTTDDKYTAFFFEVYNLVKEKYWNTLSDEQLGNVIKLSAEKIIAKPIETVPTTQNQTRAMLQNIMSTMDDAQKKDFIVKTTDVMLANLEPFGRSRLYTSKAQKELSNTVKNINVNVNHYETLKVEKDAAPEKVEQAYEEKVAELNSKSQTPEVVQEKVEVEKAKEVLVDQGNKKVYDELGVDPTIDNRLLSPRIFYIHITKFSPTTVEELTRVMAKVDSGDQLDTLIIDLRGNIGGAIDGLPFFLGPFIGNDQYAYQFYSRGNKQDFKTVTGWLPSLVRYKKVVVLTDNQVQSSGEVFAAVLKKYNVGILVGTNTKGWGTVESVFKINNQIDPESEVYSVLLVHSLTLREDGLTIEGKGVEPAISTTDPNWKTELNKYFNYQELTNEVSKLLGL